jgi:hypothetical protein
LSFIILPIFSYASTVFLCYVHRSSQKEEKENDTENESKEKVTLAKDIEDEELNEKK